MRNALFLAFLGLLAAPAAAHPRACGQPYDHGYAYRARPYRAVSVAYRVSTRHGYYHRQRRWARIHDSWGGCACRPLHGYAGCGDHFRAFGHGYGYGWTYSPYVYYGFSPHVRTAELLSRLGTVFTVEGATPGAGTADHDGLPRAPTRLVGARFLE